MTMQSKEVLRSRLNAELEVCQQHICRSRGFSTKMELGEYFLFDVREGEVLEADVDLASIALDLEVIA